MRNLTLIIIFVTIYYCCPDRSARLQTNGSSTSDDRTDVRKLIENLGNEDESSRDDQAAKLVVIAKRSRNDRDVVTSSLIEETKKMCSVKRDGRTPTLPFGEFYKLRSMADILADLREIDALDTLIDCSDISGPILGWSSANFATMGAVRKFKGDALPKLKSKMNSASNEAKCNIANVIAEFGGRTERSFLISVKSHETDKVLVSCIDSCVSYIDKR